MAVPLAQLLSSFAEAADSYTLVRLEFALHHPRLPAPPVLERLTDPSEGGARDRWDAIERQLDGTRRYLRVLEERRGKRTAYDRPFARLERSIRELDQYGRAVRWAMTVEDRRS